MTQITEDYVSFETAKLLKEKGFDEKVDTLYKTDAEFLKSSLCINYNNPNFKFSDMHYIPGKTISAPTLQMTMKWLRERGWFICIIPLAFYGGEKASKFGYNIWADDNLEVDEFDTPVFYTYEDACNAAINYCLEHLN